MIRAKRLQNSFSGGYAPVVDGELNLLIEMANFHAGWFHCVPRRRFSTRQLLVVDRLTWLWCNGVHSTVFSKQKPCFCVVKSTQVSGDGVSFI